MRPSTGSGRSRRSTATSIALVVALVVLCSACLTPVNWTQFGGGPAHGGLNSRETTISLASAATLHRRWQATLPDTADGAPVVVTGVATPAGTKTVAYVTTRRGDIAAVDLAGGAVLWSHQFGAGTCTINKGTTPCYTTSSPAVDPGLAFVYTYGLDGRVHKLSTRDGTEVVTGGWPELVTLKGFDEKGSSDLSVATARSGRSYLYMTTAGYPGDGGDYQGHVVAIDLATGAQRVFNTLCSDQAVHFVTTPGSPDCSQVQAGVWARAGTVYDSADDRLFISSGNGTYAPASHHWGDSVLALHPDGTGTATGDPIDAYTPANYAALQAGDQDLGSTLPAVLPAIAGSSVAHLGVQSGKDASLRLLDLDDLSGQHGAGHLAGEVGAIIAVPQGGEVLTQPSVWVDPGNGAVWVFVANDNGTSGFTVAADGQGRATLTRRWTTSVPGTTPMVADGVLYLAWGNQVGAYDPRSGAARWSDTTLATLHWQSPVVADGMLLIEDGGGHLDAYGP